MTAKEQGLPEAHYWRYRYVRDGAPASFYCLTHDDSVMRQVEGYGCEVDCLYTAAQMRAYALAALASDTGERGVADAGFIEAAKCARRALARACTASPEYTRAYEQLDAAITAAALRAQPAGGGEDWQARALAAEADIERMTDAFNRENGPTFMGEPVLPPEKMVELEPGVRVPLWLLDHARRVELYMKAHLPGPWRIGGIQSYDYKKEIGHE